jgi:mannose-6-phosphate isomerase-like protein (cupin superfamily)
VIASSVPLPGPVVPLGNLFPGGTSVSRLQVYPWTAPDGLAGGTPHFHTSCSEAYVVLEGSGRVQSLSSAGFDETILSPSSVVWFAPGVVHRLVNDGGLKVLVIMQNSGLPEAGDAVMTFPPAYLEDSGAYDRAARLPSGSDGATREEIESAARARQACAVDGFTALREAVETDGPAALERLYGAARSLVQPKIPAWQEIWRSGAAAAAEQTAAMFAELQSGRFDQLTTARIDDRAVPDGHAFGMCGFLDVYRLTPADAVG